MSSNFRTRTIDDFKTAESSKKNYDKAMEELERLNRISLRGKLIKKEKNVRNRNS